MNSLVELISEKDVKIALVVAAIIGTISFVSKWWRDRTDSVAILEFLNKSATETNVTFRSTEAIASKTKLTEERVATLCAKHPQIRRNTKEKQSWRLAEKAE